MYACMNSAICVCRNLLRKKNTFHFGSGWMSFEVTLGGAWRRLEERRERKDEFGGDRRRLEEPREHTHSLSVA